MCIFKGGVRRLQLSSLAVSAPNHKLLQMKLSISMVSFLLLIILATKAQGIRLDGESSAAFQKKIQEEEKSLNGGGVVLCRDDGHCSSGRNRKLITNAMAKSKISETVEMDVDGADRSLHSREAVHRNSGIASAEPSVSGHKQPPAPPETYPDVVDLAGMDYSPAKRKPPIHN